MLALAVQTGTCLLKCLEKKGSEVKRTEREKGGIQMGGEQARLHYLQVYQSNN